MPVCDRAVREAVEGRKAVDVIPYVVPVRVENVRSVAVNVYSVYALGVDVSGDMLAAVDDEDSFSAPRRLTRKACAEEPGADDKLIVMLHFCFPFLFPF